jgi:uncharacterized protein YndB with AHSA1/START domain
MPTVAASIYVEAPREVVWDVISDMRRYPEWIHFVREVFDVSGEPMEKGTTYRERAKLGPFESVSTWEVIDCARPERQVHTGRMPEGEVELRIRFRAEGSGTHWDQEMDLRMLPRVRPLGWLLERLVVRRKMQADLRRILESGKALAEREHGLGGREARGSQQERNG